MSVLPIAPVEARSVPASEVMRNSPVSDAAGFAGELDRVLKSAREREEAATPDDLSQEEKPMDAGTTTALLLLSPGFEEMELGALEAGKTQEPKTGFEVEVWNVKKPSQAGEGTGHSVRSALSAQRSVSIGIAGEQRLLGAKEPGSLELVHRAGR